MVVLLGNGNGILDRPTRFAVVFVFNLRGNCSGLTILLLLLVFSDSLAFFFDSTVLLLSGKALCGKDRSFGFDDFSSCCRWCQSSLYPLSALSSRSSPFICPSAAEKILLIDKSLNLKNWSKINKLFYAAAISVIVFHEINRRRVILMMMGRSLRLYPVVFTKNIVVSRLNPLPCLNFLLIGHVSNF
jgi:hypothetical protein